VRRARESARTPIDLGFHAKGRYHAVVVNNPADSIGVDVIVPAMPR